ncbi:hypothetical protein [Sporolactobacillus nakayamae]|uniref:Uncharacterized protein n=1 Tax=Sporolactobacillus nakayamae TaxID=269670 RepID=A0A1I2N4N8_9BACL|nr:hypothetical protein [Sporolactobacillus nakayamae]SFF98388.1 hypothetical protein SAMN02982927_00270 [Sporolactobacillus nakayamae]
MSNIICLFQPSLAVELVLTELQKNQIEQNNLACFVLDPILSKPIMQSDEKMTKAEFGFIIATIFGVIGASVGFRLQLGPIVWGVCSSFVGFLIGFVIDYLIKIKGKNKPQSFVVISICCQKDQVPDVKSILTNYHVLGLTVIES